MAVSDRAHPFHLAPSDTVHGFNRFGRALLAPFRAIARHRWLLWTLVSLVVLLVAARLAAPYAMRWEANRVINGTPSYQGGVGVVGINLFRGAYSVDNVVVSQKGSGDLEPFFTCARIDVSLSGRQLLHGHLVGSVVFRNPVVNFAEAKEPEHRQTGGTPENPKAQEPGPDGRPQSPSWTERFKQMTPIDIDQVTIVDGKMRFQNVEKGVDVYVGRLEAVVTNLTNSEGLSAERSQVATIKAEGQTVGGGHLTLSGDLDPFAQQPTFSLKLSLEHLDLPAVNPLIKAYTDADIEKGSFDLFTEMHAVDGELSGYARPLFTDLDIFKFKKDVKEGAKSAFIQAVAGATGKLLKNQPKNRLATEIPITGRVEQPGTGVMTAIAGVLKNAFVRALMPGFHHGRQDAHEPAASGEKKQEQHEQAEKQVDKATEKAEKAP